MAMEGTYEFDNVEVMNGNMIMTVSGTAYLVEDEPFDDYGCYVDAVDITEAYDEDGEPVPSPDIDPVIETALIEKLNADPTAQEFFYEEIAACWH